MTASARHGNRGVTLIELLFATAITSIVLMIGVPGLPALRAPYALRSATQQIAADFTATRMRAIARNTRYRFTFGQGTNTYVVERETTPGVFVPEGGRQRLPAGTVLGAVTDAPIFDARGMLVAAVDLPVTVPGAGTRTVSTNVLGQTTIH